MTATTPRVLLEIDDGDVRPSDGSREHAEVFLASLPSFFQDPEVCVDADGDVCFDWGESVKGVISVSVGSDGVLSVAVLWDGYKCHGTLKVSKCD